MTKLGLQICSGKMLFAVLLVTSPSGETNEEDRVRLGGTRGLPPNFFTRDCRLGYLFSSEYGHDPERHHPGRFETHLRLSHITSNWRIAVKWPFWIFLVFLGSVIFLGLYVKQAEIDAGVDRLAKIKASRSVNPDLGGSKR